MSGLCTDVHHRGKNEEGAEPKLSREAHEKYVRLMCQFSPQSVLGYLESGNALVSLDLCVSLCRQFRIADATTYLLERTGEVAVALDLILRRLAKRVQRMIGPQASTFNAEQQLTKGAPFVLTCAS
jgi:hypothetical protein